MTMPKGLQKHNLKKALKARGITPDTVDLEARIDSTLSYAENEKNIFQRLGINKERREQDGKRRVDRKVLNAIKKQVTRRQEGRSRTARAVDRAKAAKKVFPSLSRITDAELDTWFKHPNEYDIKGIDYVPGKRVKRYYRRIRRNNDD